LKTATQYQLLDPLIVQVQTTEDANGNGTLDSGEDVNSNGVLDIALFNPETFQIISAGRDEVLGTDDDLSNFWPGTRREYLDSLK
jgi:hypothetical protein